MRTSRTLLRNRRPSLRLFGRVVKEDKGQALVETALSFTLLLLLLVGAVEFARLFYASIEVSNAALAGVQYGVQSAATAGDTAGIQTAAANDAQNIALGTTTTSLSCICSNGGASTCLPTDCSGSNIETILTVNTQASFNPGFHLPLFPTSFSLHGQAVEKVLQ